MKRFPRPVWYYVIGANVFSYFAAYVAMNGGKTWPGCGNGVGKKNKMAIL